MEMAELAALIGTAASAVAGSASTILPVISTGLAVAGTVGAGIAAKKEGEFKAKQAERVAADERAAASRESEDQRRKTAYVMSEQKAKAASSGAGVTNPTILDIIGETAQRGDYVSRSKIASGENKASGYLDQAAASRYKGKNAYAGSILTGLGQAAKGIYKYG